MAEWHKKKTHFCNQIMKQSLIYKSYNWCTQVWDYILKVVSQSFAISYYSVADGFQCFIGTKKWITNDLIQNWWIMWSNICQPKLLHRKPSPAVPHTCKFPHQVWHTILHPIYFLTLQFTLIFPCDHPLHGSSSTVTEQFLYKLWYYCILHDCHYSISTVTIMIHIHVIPTQSVASAACPNFILNRVVYLMWLHHLYKLSYSATLTNWHISC